MLKVSDITIKNLKNGKFKSQLPEFYDLKKVTENNRFHNNQSVFDHTLLVLENLESIFKDKKLKRYLSEKIGGKNKKQLLFFTTTFHDIGKKDTIIVNKGISSCPAHEIDSSKKIKRIIKLFDLTPKDKKYIVKIIEIHGFLHDLMAGNRTLLNKNFRQLQKKIPSYILDLLILTKADTMGLNFKPEDKGEIDFRINFYNKILNDQS